MNIAEYENVIELYRKKEISRDEFEDKINFLTNNIETPLKEFYKIYCYLYKNNYVVPKDKREYIINNALIILENNNIDEVQKSAIKCATMNACFSECKYEIAESYANNLLNDNSEDVIVLRNIADYFTKTRRYKIAENIYKKIIKTNDENVLKDYEVYCNIINHKRKPYMPSNNDNKEMYAHFLEKIGLADAKALLGVKQPEKIKVGEYPLPIEKKIPDFNSFIAFDVETTGIDHSKDSITEIAAIKVVNGEIVEKKDFIFQELVKPYKKKIPKNVEELTGITNKMVAECRNIWEVFPDFVKFIENNVLVGYNCMTFDSKFLVRAGRLSNLIINNQYFDVMHLVKKYKKSLDTENMTLVQVGKALGIENPQAHRALADAITTAKVYLKILELNRKED